MNDIAYAIWVVEKIEMLCGIKQLFFFETRPHTTM